MGFSGSAPVKSSEMSQVQNICKNTMFDFEDEHEITINKMLLEIDKISDKIHDFDYESKSPDGKLIFYDKIFQILEEIETFCKSHGDAGLEYFSYNIQSDVDFWVKEKQNFIENDLPEEKQMFLDHQEHKQYLKNTKSALLKLLKAEPILQSVVFSHFKPEEKNLITKLIKELEANNSITKTKNGQTYLIKFNKTTNT